MEEVGWDVGEEMEEVGVGIGERKWRKRVWELGRGSEVDLLGDKVDALSSLLEKIYMALDHYSPVLQHYSGVIETLKLVRRELGGKFTKPA
ncbi:hypothetical protein Pint_11250 [Pistacia integerrima]|uniref:Uncharacterized protein n=1 Tax=Pistacia integerrima TaxID=434235 RepID=A0ACC0XML4_9ROSI|nr:hypothetical protein Pint_11250 [Pistacia integerrima]